MLRQLIVYLRANRSQIYKFARKVGIDERDILGLIDRERELTFEQLRQVASKLKVSLSDLLGETSEKINFHFRSNAVNFNQLLVTEKAGLLINSLHAIVSKYNQSSSMPNQIELEDERGIRELANAVRVSLLSNDYGRPLLDLAYLIADRYNIYIIVKDIGADGVSAIIDEYAYIVISPRFGPRMLFTLAHELAHHILRHHENGLIIDFSHDHLYSKGGESRSERAANEFASNLLMPASSFARKIIEVKGQNEHKGTLIGDFDILLTSFHFGVSFEVAALRCEKLGLLPSGSARSMYEVVKKEFRSPELRGKASGAYRDDQPIFPLAASNNVLYSLFKAIDEGEISASKAASMIGISLEMLLDVHNQLSDELYN
jgi:Zn-dependent peptidase ImmA (M78 family)